jgi:diguanylate cyclase (GGDEF)-like protein
MSEHGAGSRDNLLESILGAFTGHIAVLDDQGKILYTNHAWRQLQLELGPADAGGGIPISMFDACHLPNRLCDGALAVHGGLEDILSGSKDVFTLEYSCFNGVRERWFNVHITPLEHDEACAIITFQEITEDKHREESIRHMAYHDPLTGLANRRLFREHAEHVLSLAKRNFQNVAVVALDLNGFKAINDTYGHELGDDLLVAVSKRLEEVFRATDVVARLGGDEFVVLLSDIKVDEVMEVLKRSQKVLLEPYRLQGQTVHVGASIGAAFFPQHATSVKRIMRCADAAMYHAKEKRSGIEIFQLDMSVG